MRAIIGESKRFNRQSGWTSEDHEHTSGRIWVLTWANVELRFGSCYYTTVLTWDYGSAVGEADLEVLGWFGQLERGEDGLLSGGADRALRDLAVGGDEGDQAHAVELVAQVAPGVAGGVLGDADEQ